MVKPAGYPRTARFRNPENVKRKAHLIKWRSMENLDKLLPEFESNAQSRGIKVIWASDDTEAQAEISAILKKNDVGTVVRSDSPITAEIDLDTLLKREDVQSLDNDPASERNAWVNADAGIAGVSFLIAETGSVALAEDGGSSRLSSSLPGTYIAIAGIEDVIPSLRDLDIFWPLLVTHSPNEESPACHTLISGPRQAGEKDGPAEMYVILLDNGRSDLLARSEQRQGLYCIHCEACLHVCPVYQHMGPEAYGTTYTGPIGSLITPHTRGMKEFRHLSETSTLCGKCTEVCPVNIDISRMLLLNRRDAVRDGYTGTTEKLIWKSYTRVMSGRKWLDFLSSGTKNFLLRFFLKKKWGNQRSLPTFKKKSFSEQMKEQKKNTT